MAAVRQQYIVLMAIFLLFVTGCIPEVLGDFGKWLTDDDELDTAALPQANSKSHSLISEPETERNENAMTGRFGAPQS